MAGNTGHKPGMAPRTPTAASTVATTTAAAAAAAVAAAGAEARSEEAKEAAKAKLMDVLDGKMRWVRRVIRIWFYGSAYRVHSRGFLNF